MKIAMVSEHASPLAVIGGVDAGGQNVHVAALAAGMLKRGHEVTVFTRRDDPDLPRRVRARKGYVVEHVPAGPATDVPKDELLPHMGAFADYLASRWAAERFDIAHAHFWMSGLAATQAAAVTGVPVVQTFHALGTVKRRHQGPKDTSPPERIAIETRLCADVDHIIATCADEVAELSMMGLGAGRASIVPCGVDLGMFQPAPPLSESGRAPRLLVVGRLVERKGVADVIDALRELPGVELTIAGGPAPDLLAIDPDVARLREHANAAGVADRVRLLGRVDRPDLPALFAACDVVVAVPWYEPFGIVPLEAMACARPVIGSAVGGLLDTIEPGTTGELVPPRSPGRLALAIGDLLADRRRREAYGAAGVRRVRERYGWAAVARATERVYARVAARARDALSTEFSSEFTSKAP
jgi:glycosyltransferase involved in cell wall biosynthesis